MNREGETRNTLPEIMAPHLYFLLDVVRYIRRYVVQKENRKEGNLLAVQLPELEGGILESNQEEPMYEKYDQYIALDYSKKTIAFARLTAGSEEAQVKEIPTHLGVFKSYLENLRGRKILTFEESTGSQWLYTELRPLVDELVVCDPHRNRLLEEGRKDDKIDAVKLVKLLRGNYLKPVFHSGDYFIELRALVSGYEDVVKSGVRWKNQRSSLMASIGQGEKKGKEVVSSEATLFVLKGIEAQVSLYEKEKERYQEHYKLLAKKHSQLRQLMSIPGIGLIGAVTILAMVVDPRRFENKGRFWSYCGLIHLERRSGGKLYGKTRPRFCRRLKYVFKTAAFVAIHTCGDNALKAYYTHLIQTKHLAIFQARHAVARKIASIALGVLRTDSSFKISRKEKVETHDLNSFV